MSNEGSANMDKQLPRQPQGLHKSNGTAVERRNDIPPSRNGRQKRGKDPGARSQESHAPVPRPMQKSTKFNNDKRPRQRGYYDDRRREEVTEEEDSSFGEPLYASNSRKGNGNHLLSFQYERRGAQTQHVNWSQYKGATRPRYNYKTARYNKEQFLQASYQFVVRDSGQYVEQAINPDALVTWDMVELVRNLTSEEVKCSICLMPPMAGKITKCGHTYCWACILHYLSTDESDRQGCPLCHQPVSSEELRSIQHIQVPQYKEGDQIEMKLMRKKKGSVYVCPSAQWIDRKEKPLNIHDGAATAFNKVLLASGEQIYSDVVETEKAALAVQLMDAEDYETGYIVMAQDLLTKREIDLKERIRSVSTTSSTSDDQTVVSEEEPVVTVPLPPNESFDGSQITTTYTDAFEDEAESEPKPSTEKPRQESVGEEVIPFETFHEESQSEVSSAGATSASGEDMSDMYERFEELSMLAAEADMEAIPIPESTMTASEAADHLELPHESPGGGQAKRANQSKDIYYFYQASTGQHIYLNSLNVQCLVKEYGNLESSPDIITGTVVAIDRIFINEEMRKRFRYLNHIPLTCEIQIVELKLQMPIISKDTIKTFQAEFDKRRKMRQRKQKAEKQRARNYEAEQRKKEPYHGYHIVRSEQYQPVAAAQSPPETGDWPAEHSPRDNTASPGGATGTCPPAEEDGNPATKSFAQIIKSSKSVPTMSAAPGQGGWPRVTSSPTMSPQKTPGEEEEGRAPSYADSVFQAWGRVTFKTPPKNQDEASSSTPKSSGKKKKKKDGGQVVFSTHMVRKT